jgi:PKD repeat protein
MNSSGHGVEQGFALSVTRRAVLSVSALVLAASVALGVVFSGGSARSAIAASGPLAGVTGNIARFRDLTGQDSQVDQAFLSWGQGVSFGSPFAALLPTLAPIPLVHLGTVGRDGREAITPGGIAAGQGDSYLIALNEAIAGWGKGIYVRPLAEMNNPGNLYAGYNKDGTPRDVAHSPATYRKAFARIYLILHGGSAGAIDAKLRALGLPPLGGGDLAVNPFPRLRVVWSPLAGGLPRASGNAPAMYYPGAAFVDVDGGDIYDEGLTDNAPWTDLEALYRLALSHRKPFSVPEWGLIGVDDPAFVEHMCSFLGASGATEMQAFTQGKPGSVVDIASKPKSSAAYRQCLTPLAGPVPGWAAGVEAKVIALSLTANPASGPSPLSVQLAIVARLSVPIEHWQLFFGDGAQVEGDGPPPASAKHAYAQDGDYQATLVVYSSPPFKLEAARFLATAAVTAGTGARPLVGFKWAPAGGRTPLAVSFQIDLNLPGAVSGWEIVLGDGFTLKGAGRPPHFTGHTYKTAGSYRAILIVDGSPNGRFVTFADITVSGGTVQPPASATRTGTVLVSGKPFTGGTIPYGSKVDVTKGTLTLRTDTGTLTVYGAGVPAAFLLLRGTDSGKPIVELRLTGGNFQVCGKSGRKIFAAGAKKPPKTVRRLWSKGKGRFRTRGRYAAAVVRGTWWLTADRCDGTLVTVKQGTVRVSDLRRHRTVSVRAGRSYLAKP